jgi:hypothetical protein
MPKSFTMHDAHQNHSKHGCKFEDANYKNKTLKTIEKMYYPLPPILIKFM